MATFSTHFILIITLLFLHHFDTSSPQQCHSHSHSQSQSQSQSGDFLPAPSPPPESQEGGCSPPSPAPSNVLTFLDQKLAAAFPVIQHFKATITSDPLNIINTWTGPDICSYTGFICDNPPDNLTATTIAAVDFNGFGLSAPSINNFIDQLPDLAIFHANSNNFSGTISPKIASLQYLYEIDISNNKFSGPFPDAILQIPTLTFLDIRYNSFTGSLPAQVFNRSLDVLFINNNNFMQRLPTNLGSLPAFFLTLANNKFTGPIPPSIGRLSATLTEVLFLNNMLTGCLPFELGNLTEAVVIDAENNLITGPLPCSLSCLQKAEVLNFAGNLLFGRIPESLCGVSSLINLSLSGNYFTSAGPICRKMIRKGVLDVRKNCIFDQLGQRSLRECAVFFLQPRLCPFMSLYSVIPCRKIRTVASHAHKRPRKNGRHGSDWVTYSALKRKALREP
ncbi:unnamed protein product [Rhodiola kirilowii]